MTSLTDPASATLRDRRQRLQALITDLPEDSLRQIETLLITVPSAPAVGVASALEEASASAEASSLKSRFDHLAAQWKQETRGLSSTTALSMNPAYQQIIGMGQAIIPLLLRELEARSGRWFWALKSITGTDPVPPEHQGQTRAMTEAWLTWGRGQGYQW
jgi:hypothetical protein